MRLDRSSMWLGGVAVLALAVSPRASAALTVIGRYTLVAGDTITRATYYSGNRVRVTVPDGRELIYDAKAKQVTVINHRDSTYWRGPTQQADSLATKILYEKNVQLKPKIEANREKWLATMQTFNDSLKVFKTEETRKIAGYPCTKWVLSVGPYMRHERWVAASLSVANYGPELQKIVDAMVFDPLGRSLMRQLVVLREQDGLPLAASTSFATFTQNGAFAWEAIEVKSGPIPDEVWEVPKAYRRIKL